MIDARREAWLRLARVPGLGPVSLVRLLRVFGDPEAILAASAHALREHLRTNQVDALLQAAPISTVEQSWLSTEGNHMLTLEDAEYPRQLLEITDPPPVLFAKGQLELLQTPGIALVGSRSATVSGLRHAEAFAAALAARGVCVVSGLAEGIDTAAHQGALQAEGSTIAVVATGLDRVYPASNRQLAHQIARQGLLLSEFALGTPPLAGHFPRRNRLISGLSRACLVVEATENSGSLITARLALEQGRDVFAIPGSIDAPQSRGCHRLIKQGAKLVDCVEDILEELPKTIPAQPPLPKASMTAPDLPDARLPQWLVHFGLEPFHFDTAQESSGLTPAELCAMLLELEMAGLVSSLPGARYQRMP